MAENEFPGVSEAALALAEKHHTERRNHLLNVPAEQLPEGFQIPDAWEDLEPFGRTAVAQSMIPTIMIVAPHITEAVKSQARTESVVKLFAQKTKDEILAVLPDSIPNKEMVLSAILGIIDDAQSEG